MRPRVCHQARTVFTANAAVSWSVPTVTHPVLAAETGWEITVCHFPPGTSKWNKIEHRLFSQITMNWRGRPLTSHETILQLIGATTTATGLTVTATLDTGSYPIGIKISDREMAALPITRDEFHGDWNYTLRPTRDTPEPA